MNMHRVAHHATVYSVVILAAMVPLGTIVTADLAFKWDLLPPVPEKVVWLTLVFLILNLFAALAVSLQANLQRVADAAGSMTGVATREESHE